MLNADLSADRKRWTLAHDLGHLVLHSSDIDPDVETQANDFAAEFLMPSHVIRHGLAKPDTRPVARPQENVGCLDAGIFEHGYRLGKVTSAERTKFYRMLNA